MPQQEELILRLHAEGLSGSQIVEATGAKRFAVYGCLNKHGIVGKQYGYLKNLSEWQEAILLGTLMGDGCLKRAQPHHNAQLKMGHSHKQLAYLEWKADQLRPLYTDSVRPYHYRTKEGYDTYELASRSHPLLTEYYELLYPGGRKTLTAVLMDRIASHPFFPAIMAVWYMDDGSTNQGGARLCVGNFDEEQYKLLDVWLGDQGWRTTRHRMKPGSNCWSYYFRSESSRRFFQLVAPYFHESLKYKIPAAAG